MNTSKIIKLLPFLKKNKIVGNLYKNFHFTDEPKFAQWICKSSLNKCENNNGVSTNLNEETAKAKAIAESAERYYLLTPNQSIYVESYKNLINKSLNPQILINFDTNLFNKKREEYLGGLINNPISWVEGQCYKTKNKVFIPAQVVYSNYNSYSEPFIRYPISTGTALGFSKQGAINRGILEIIERDNFMRFWLAKDNKLFTRLNPNKEISKIINYFDRYLIKPYIFDISLDSEFPTVMSLLIDKTGIGPAVSIGLKSSKSELESVVGSLLEAQQVRSWIRFCYNNENGPTINDTKEVVDFKSRGFYWYNQKRIKELEFLIGGNIKKKDISDKSINLNQIRDKIISMDYDLYFVELEDERAKSKNLYVIKSIIPQLHPLTYNENIPYTESISLKKILDNSINKIPHPFL